MPPWWVIVAWIIGAIIVGRVVIRVIEAILAVVLPVFRWSKCQRHGWHRSDWCPTCMVARDVWLSTHHRGGRPQV